YVPKVKIQKMNIQAKPIELQQAQVALYAGRQSESIHPGRERTLLAHLGEVGLHTPQDAPDLVTYPRKITKKGFVDGEIVVLEPAGTPLPLFDKQELAELLRNERNREQSRNLAEMMRNFSQLKPAIDEISIPHNNYDSSGKHPSLLGRGSNKAAFGFRAAVDGVEKDLVAIVDHGSDTAHSQKKMLERAANLALVKGMRGFEQGVAWSNDPAIVVAEKALGKELDKLSTEEKAMIPVEHWDTLAKNVADASDLGVQLDPMPGNFFYDPEVGFTVIDFRRSNAGKEAATLTQNMKDIQKLRDDIAKVSI
ncbi:MAG: hypothetical protein WCJ60_04270, partial [bacterium]